MSLGRNSNDPRLGISIWEQLYITLLQHSVGVGFTISSFEFHYSSPKETFDNDDEMAWPLFCAKLVLLDIYSYPFPYKNKIKNMASRLYPFST